jgi:endonuclease III
MFCLLFCSEKPTIPVDTHVNRVAKRLGLAPQNGNYETVRKSLQSLYNSKGLFGCSHVADFAW